MKIKNPQTLTFPNGDGLPIDMSLNTNDTIAGFAVLDVNSHGSGGVPKNGSAQLQTAANGNVTIRVHLSPENPIHVLIVDSTGVLFEG